MRPDLQTSLRRVEYGAIDMASQIRRRIGALINPHRTVQLLFYGPDGKVKPEAIEWLGRLASRNFIDSSAFDPDPRVHARNEGRREMMLEILGSLRLDTTELARLQGQLREIEE